MKRAMDALLIRTKMKTFLEKTRNSIMTLYRITEVFGNNVKKRN
jgi:hypothetical protein